MTSQLWNKAIFDYLNNNRHKFDEQGNFDPKPDRRDYLPLAGPIGGAPWWWKYVRQDKTPDDVSIERNAAELEAWKDGVRYTEKECLDEYEKDLELCDDGPGGRVRRACRERAGNRLTNCYSTGSYNRQGRWTFQDATGQPQGDEDPDRRRKSKSEGNPQPEANPKPEDSSDESKRAMSGGTTETVLGMHPWLLAYLVANPEMARALHDSSADMRAFLRKFVLAPSDYPRGLEPETPYSPPPHLQSALTAPLGGLATGARLPMLAPR